MVKSTRNTKILEEVHKILKYLGEALLSRVLLLEALSHLDVGSLPDLAVSAQ